MFLNIVSKPRESFLMRCHVNPLFVFTNFKYFITELRDNALIKYYYLLNYTCFFFYFIYC